MKTENKEDQIPEKHPVFGFPDSKPDLKAKWVKFVSWKSWLPTKNACIYTKHFEERFLTLSFPLMPYGVIDFRILQELQKSLSVEEVISFVLLQRESFYS